MYQSNTRGYVLNDEILVRATAQFLVRIADAACIRKTSLSGCEGWDLREAESMAEIDINARWTEWRLQTTPRGVGGIAGLRRCSNANMIVVWWKAT